MRKLKRIHSHLLTLVFLTLVFLHFITVLLLAVPLLAEPDAAVTAEAVAAEPAAAAELDAGALAELEKITQEISDTTMSPFCPGRTLSACPSEQARQLRMRIFGWLKKGYSPTGVRNQLLTIYGGDVRGTPKPEGFGLMAWIMPVVFVLVCFLLVAVLLRRVKKGDDTEPDAPVSDEMKTRISNELEHRR